MIDWGSLISGLIGALIGGGASFGVQAFVSSREWQTKRFAAVSRVDAAFRGLLREGASRTKTNPNTEKFFDALIESRAAIMALRLVLKPAEIPVATWLDARREHFTTEVATTAPRAIAVVPEIDGALVNLTEWVTGQRKWSTFAS